MFIEASYEKDQERIQDLKNEMEQRILQATPESVEAEQARIKHETETTKLKNVQQQLIAYADSAPLGLDCSMAIATGWLTGAVHLVDSLLQQRDGFFANVTLSSSDDARVAVHQSHAALRAAAANLTPNMLR